MGTDIINAFLHGDCWALAAEMQTRYPELEIVSLGWADEPTYWFTHVLVFDKNTGLYYDVAGAHTLDEVKEAWSSHDWDTMHTVTPDVFEGTARVYPEISLNDGVKMTGYKR